MSASEGREGRLVSQPLGGRVSDPPIRLSPLTDDEAAALKARFLESLAHPRRLIVVPEGGPAPWTSGWAPTLADLTPVGPTQADVDAAYRRGLDDGRRQATEGFWREWGVELTGEDDGVIWPADNERDARDYDGQAVSRLVGPWEPADHAPTPVHPEGGVRAAATALEGAEGIGVGGDGGYRDGMADDLAIMTPARRLRSCVAQWPGAYTGGYDPRCCRFPKSCSASVYDEDRVGEDALEHDPGAPIEEPDDVRLDGEFADDRGKFEPLIGEETDRG